LSYKYLTAGLVDVAAAYGMEVNSEKCKIVIGTTENVETTMSGQRLEQVDAIKYPVSTLTTDNRLG